MVLDLIGISLGVFCLFYRDDRIRLIIIKPLPKINKNSYGRMSDAGF